MLLLSLGMASSLTFAALSVFSAQRGVFDLDRSAVELVALLRRGSLQTPMEIVSLLGQETVLVPLILLASVCIWPHRRRWAFALPVAMAGAGALQFVAKWTVD